MKIIFLCPISNNCYKELGKVGKVLHSNHRITKLQISFTQKSSSTTLKLLNKAAKEWAREQEDSTPSIMALSNDSLLQV